MRRLSLDSSTTNENEQLNEVQCYDNAPSTIYKLKDKMMQTLERTVYVFYNISFNNMFVLANRVREIKYFDALQIRIVGAEESSFEYEFNNRKDEDLEDRFRRICKVMRCAKNSSGTGNGAKCICFASNLSGKSMLYLGVMRYNTIHWKDIEIEGFLPYYKFFTILSYYNIDRSTALTLACKHIPMNGWQTYFISHCVEPNSSIQIVNNDEYDDLKHINKDYIYKSCNVIASSGSAVESALDAFAQDCNAVTIFIKAKYNDSSIFVPVQTSPKGFQLTTQFLSDAEIINKGNTRYLNVMLKFRARSQITELECKLEIGTEAWHFIENFNEMR